MSEVVLGHINVLEEKFPLDKHIIYSVILDLSIGVMGRNS